MNRKHGIDFLKIVATILVIFHHYQQTTGVVFERINFWNGKFYFGWIVELFFVISGYLMYTYRNRIRDGKVNLLSFMKKRFMRLFPTVLAGAIAYEFFLYIYVCVMGNDWSGISPNLWGIVLDSLMVQHGWGFSEPWVNYPTWYISNLFLCYLWFYILTKYAQKKGFDEIYLYILMVFVGVSINTYGIEIPFFNSSVCRGYYAFFWGLILGRLMPAIQDWIRVHKVKACFILLIVVIGIPIMIHKECIWVQSNIQYIMTYIYYTCLLVLFEMTYVNKIFCAYAFDYIGRVSFAVYIWHNPLFILLYILINMNVLSADIVSSFGAMCIYTVVCYGVGIVSYQCIERPKKPV